MLFEAGSHREVVEEFNNSQRASKSHKCIGKLFVKFKEIGSITEKPCSGPLNVAGGGISKHIKPRRQLPRLDSARWCPPFYAMKVRNYRNIQFREYWIGRRIRRSSRKCVRPVLTPLDYFLWSHFKAKMYPQEQVLLLRKLIG